MSANLITILGTDDWLIFGMLRNGSMVTWMTEMWEQWLDAPEGTPVTAMIPFIGSYGYRREESFIDASKPLSFAEFLADYLHSVYYFDSFSDPNEWSGLQPIHYHRR